MGMPMKEISRVVGVTEGRLLERLRALVEVESPSEDKAGVDRAGALVAGWAVELGGKIKRHKQKAAGDVLEVRFGAQGKARGRVMLLTHLDTVWPMGTLKKMPWRSGGGKIYGPGILDMKAGVVMALEAIAALQHLDSQGLGKMRPVTLLLNSDEEVGSTVSRPVTEALARECAAVFVLEPAQDLAYKTSRKGVGHFDLRVEGVAAHSGVDFERGHSAVLE